MTNSKVELNEYGNLTELPKGYTVTDTNGNLLRKLNIKYYKIRTDWSIRNGKAKPILKNVITRYSAKKLESYLECEKQTSEKAAIERNTKIYDDLVEKGIPSKTILSIKRTLMNKNNCNTRFQLHVMHGIAKHDIDLIASTLPNYHGWIGR
jgi:hypothetical protein